MKWAYKTAVIPGSLFLGKVPEVDLANVLTEFGEEQWELVCALYTSDNSSVLLFKRPK